MLWHSCSDGFVYDRQEGLAVFFDSISGNTHLVDDLAIKILKLLSVSPLSSESIKKECIDQIDHMSSIEQDQFLEGVLFELHSLDLIE
jgi:PqqD family protein of HPr-rel-A system